MGFVVQGLEFMVGVVGFGVQGLGLREQCLGLKGLVRQGVGFRVQSFARRIPRFSFGIGGQVRQGWNPPPPCAGFRVLFFGLELRV